VKPSAPLLEQAQVDALPTGSIVTVLWHGFKSALFDYRVENIGGDAYCVKVRIGNRWRNTAAPLLIHGVVTKRAAKRSGTVVMLRELPACGPLRELPDCGPC
jgi:hypothetical protein